MSDLCSNMQGVLKMVASGKIKVNADNPKLRALKTYDKDICQALNNRRKCMERIKSPRTGPLSRSIASLANTALAHREELGQQGRWKRFLKGEDMRHMEPKGEEEKDPQDQVKGSWTQTPSKTGRLTENKTVNKTVASSVLSCSNTFPASVTSLYWPLTTWTDV